MAEDLRRPRPGLLGRSLNLLMAVLSTLLVALLFSVLIEWLGMWLWWPDHPAERGQLHAQAMFRQEVAYLHADFARGLSAVDPVAFATATALGCYRALFVWFGVDLARLTAQAVRGTLANDFVVSATYVVMLFGVRLAIAVLTLPGFLLVAAVSACEGLARRDLRKWSGGTESGWLYHHAKRFLLPTLFAAWLLYLGMPFAIHPNGIFLPAMLLFGLATEVTTATFKKYL
ncbi:TIGR03747 family integrating conjugative element membrane protein [Endothiovibrio diazotrophicus]